VEEAEDEHGEEARTSCFGDQSGFTSDEEEDRDIELESESSYSDDNGDVPVKILAEDDVAGTVVVEWADGGSLVGRCISPLLRLTIVSGPGKIALSKSRLHAYCSFDRLR
jgi:hypothetical protein